MEVAYCLTRLNMAPHAASALPDEHIDSISTATPSSCGTCKFGRWLVAAADANATVCDCCAQQGLQGLRMRGCQVTLMVKDGADVVKL